MIGVGCSGTNSPSSSSTGTSADLSVSAADLVAAYRKDPAAADQQYKSKVVTITGPSAGGGGGGSGTSPELLIGSDTIDDVRCTFPASLDPATSQKIAMVKGGDPLTIKGTVNGLDRTNYVSMTNCQLIQPSSK